MSDQAPRPDQIRRRQFAVAPAAAFALSLIAALAAGVFNLDGAAAGSAFAAPTAPAAQHRANLARDAAEAAIDAFDDWRRAAAKERRARAPLRQRAAIQAERAFLSRLNDVEALALSAPPRIVADRVRTAHAQWTQSEPLEDALASLAPLVDDARSAQMREHLSLLVEITRTDELKARRDAVTVTEHARRTKIVTLFAAFAALAGLLVWIMRSDAFRPAPAPAGRLRRADMGDPAAPFGAEGTIPTPAPATASEELAARRGSARQRQLEQNRRRAADRLAAMRAADALRARTAGASFARRFDAHQASANAALQGF